MNPQTFLPTESLSFLLFSLWPSLLPGAFALQEPAKVQDQARDVTEIDIEDLLRVRVISPGKKEQPLQEVPAAVYIIRGEDLKRSGATSVAEALRAVPGLQVARATSSSWAISARGFNSTLANKLLVLIDGRSVYSPLHSGVFWDVQDLFLEDIERIEVVRGPGGSLWGTNAVNGVINIITKPARETQSAVVTGGIGTEERVFGSARYGFKAAEDLYLRVYAKYFGRDAAADGDDPDHRAHDAWWMARTGFRSDWKAGEQDRWVFRGDFYDGQEQVQAFAISLSAPFSQSFNERAELRGGDLLLRWQHQFDPASDLSIQLYYDHVFRSETLFRDLLHTGDFDSQHRFRLFEGHDVSWGLGYRIHRIDLRGSSVVESDPQRRTDDIVSAFLQDEIQLIENRLRLTLGSKFEHNDYSGFEYQPSARLAWHAGERHMTWASVSRAVRTPSLFERDIRLNIQVIPTAPPTLVSILPNPDFRSEVLFAYEVGYRVRPADPLSLDFALFYNRYDHLASTEAGTPFFEPSPPPPHAVFPLRPENEMQAQTWGVELATNLQAASWWLFQANYTYLRMNLDPTSESTDTSTEDEERQNPRHQVWLRSAMDLSSAFALDVMVRYVSALSDFDIGSYIEADLRLAWRDEARGLEASLVGQNLVHASHPEFDGDFGQNEIQRGVYFSLTGRF
ncbi:MAG: TonB-dependent receptor [Planctomycetes bacterium]|nr:TonB-dependent receptor [Planctomycetota bacterium]